MKKYINFDIMITPLIIKILFWVGVAASVIFGLLISFGGLGTMFSGFRGTLLPGFVAFVGGILIIGVGVLVSRIYCELIIVAFKAVEKLNSIDEKLDKRDEIL